MFRRIVISIRKKFDLTDKTPSNRNSYARYEACALKKILNKTLIFIAGFWGSVCIMTVVLTASVFCSHFIVFPPMCIVAKEVFTNISI
jgi:hypothetical protein